MTERTSVRMRLRDHTITQNKEEVHEEDRMVAKLKAKFIPKDYQINLFRKM